MIDGPDTHAPTHEYIIRGNHIPLSIETGGGHPFQFSVHATTPEEATALARDLVTTADLIISVALFDPKTPSV